MIKANELRIGSFVNYTIDKISIFQGKITTITKNVLVIDSAVTKYINVKPIPLTEEILLKCGFKFKKCGPCGQDQWANLDIWSIPCSDTGNFITIRGSSRNSFILYPYGTYIHSLHQLQNLYFALTGEELEINL